MKSATILALAAALFLSMETTAQQKTRTFRRCATMDRVSMYEANNNAFKTAAPEKAKRVMDGPDAGNFRLQGLVSIPVVVHVVLPNPYLVTDADVQAQIDRLNQDFAGLNADSTNALGFYTVRGHSQIRFCLARRTPSGQLTSGIDRRWSATGSDATASTDPIKRTSLGGLDAWNTAQYLNLWIGTDVTGQGILGYADNVGVGSGTDDGVFLNYKAFGSSACYSMPQYNLGRTATHEIGHYFGLYHIWGDDNGTCNGDDFAQLPSSTSCSLPNGLFNPTGTGNGTNDVGDTPNQGDATTTCPVGDMTDGCATNSPGKMYQNHMDYTQDACLSMFTRKQVARMEWVLDNCRAGLKTSLGCQTPANAVLLDAGVISSLSPGGAELIGCASVYYTDTLSCPGNLTPKCMVVNHGLATLTTLAVGYSYDNGNAVTQTVSVNIPPGGTYIASFPAIAVAVGQHTLRFFTASPNGGTDAVPANDSYIQNFVVLAPAATPLNQGFETSLSYTDWTIDNPDFDFTWQRTTPGRDGSLGKLSIDNYYTEGINHVDDFRSTAITVDPASAYLLSFDLAHKNYPDANNSDTLAVLISTDCGQTFKRVYSKGGEQLATAGASDLDYSQPGEGDWRTENISLSGALIATGKVIVVFQNISGYGNWIHLDNISLAKVGARDLQVVEITSPGSTVCSGSVTPAVTVQNVGLETVTAFSIGYRIDQGPVFQQTFTQTIKPGDSATVSLPLGTTLAGPHTLTAFSFSPVAVSGTGDTRLTNDTLTKSFTVVRLSNTPVVEDFENAFPSPGWRIVNPNNNVTWTRTAPGKASQYAVYFNNFNSNVIDETDDLRTPFIDVSGADSVLVRFDLAHKNYQGSIGDNLSVLTTADCGNSFTPVYSKTGAALATSGSTQTEYTNPAAADWKTERIVLNAQALRSGSLALAFRNTNGFSNNIFIDNISITAVYQRDVQVVSIQQPRNFVCGTTVTPSVTVRNNGTDTAKSLRLVYSVNNGTPVSQTVTGLSLPKGAETVVSLAPVTNLVQGSYLFTVYQTDLVTAKGSADLNRSNDTVRLVFAVPGTVNAPLEENFTAAGFPPNGWSVLNGDNAMSWQRHTAGNGNEGSAFLNTYRYFTLGQKDDLVSPVIDYGTVDSVRLDFDLAAAVATTGTASLPVDTLEVMITKDCGNSFTPVYKKWGNDLQTLGTNATQVDEFVPQGSGNWRTESIDISSFADGGPIVIFFRATNNNENNLFIDNVAVKTKILPSLLKQQGYLVYPSPFQSRFVVWHYQTPVDLRYIRVMTATGQTLWTKQYTGNAGKQEAVDLSGKPAGIYFVEIGYNGGKKAVTQRLIKQ